MEPADQGQPSTSLTDTQSGPEKTKKGVTASKSTSRRASLKIKAKALQKSTQRQDRFSASRQRALEKQFSRAEKQLKAVATAATGALSPQLSPERPSQLSLSPTRGSNVTPEATFTPTAAGLRDVMPQQDFMSNFQQMLEKTLSQGFAGIQHTLQTIMVPTQQGPADDALSISNSLIPQNRGSTEYDMQAESDVSSHEGDARDPTLSGDEDTAPDPPAFASLFPSEIFKSLLAKAKVTTELGAAPASQQAETSSSISSQTLFSPHTPPTNFIPTPLLVTGVIKKQWLKPGTQPSPNTTDKKYYQGDQDIVNLLQLPKVDDPIVGVASPALIPGDAIEALKPEEKKMELALRAAHQAATWAIRAASAATFFNRATLLWLQQMESRLPLADTRLQQDLNKIKAATQFSADATLDSVRFASKSLASSIASRRLLWLRGWQADVRAKWRLASGPFQGDSLFGEIIEPLLTENKDKKKILPPQRKRAERRFQPYNRKPPQRTEFQQDQNPRQYYKTPDRLQDRYKDRYRPQNQPKRPFRGAGGRPFRKSR